MKKGIWFIAILTAIAITAGVAIKIKTNNLPASDINIARKKLYEARLEKSADFAAPSYQQALIYYDSAMIEWGNQNRRFILFRNYGKVSELSKKSFESSLNAINKARINISETEENLASRLDNLGARIKNFDKIFDKFPMTKKQRGEIEKCRLLYLEGMHAYSNKNYESCKSKLDSAELLLNKVFIHFQDKVASYFREYPVWQKQIKQSLEYSKKNKTYIVIVDKFARELLICKNGETEKRFTVELSTNWIGDKQQRGDKTTPEGLYKIIEKKQNRQTKYYKALLLDYPNEEDKKRFALNKKNGTIKPEARIGNLIEIHGNGGKGIDWTNGCIAVSNPDMDVIFNLCPVGTKVTIVGTTKTMDEFLNNLK